MKVVVLIWFRFVAGAIWYVACTSIFSLEYAGMC